MSDSEGALISVGANTTARLRAVILFCSLLCSTLQPARGGGGEGEREGGREGGISNKQRNEKQTPKDHIDIIIDTLEAQFGGFTAL